MKKAIYSKLAAEGIRKNKRMFIPYILTGSIMVMMFYILSFLVESPTLSQMPGGDSLAMILPLGIGVIGFFSFIFLFYTNSFLIRQRNREFGLYNVLGMDKRNISRIILWESGIVMVLSIAFGLLFGVAFSKFAELGLLNLLHLDISYRLHIGMKSLIQTTGTFALIYLILTLHSLWKVGRLKPLELLQSNRVGEKPPKGNWLLALLGMILLAVAYYFAVTIKEPLTVMMIFFLAVLMVIAATYLLFIAGSVVLCRTLQKKKSYYYKPNHFVSVSSMVYRMKRNGAGLASICILLTMVLVMISSTASLYIGTEDALVNRYPHDINVSVSGETGKGFSREDVETFRKTVEKYSEDAVWRMDYTRGQVSGMFTEDQMLIDVEEVESSNLLAYDDVGYLQVFSLEDYNRLMGTEEELREDECLIYCVRTEYQEDTFRIAGQKSYRVKKVLDTFFDDGEINMLAMPSLCIVVSDFDAFTGPILEMKTSGGQSMMQITWKCGMDLAEKVSVDQKMERNHQIWEELNAMKEEGIHGIKQCFAESREANRRDFFSTYGSLFFLGIILSIVFLFAAVLIIYYKQISEGYEDQARFEIMQKVGMTKKEIHKSINSQILTVFFLPLVFAGLHLAFAFPMIWKLLQLFNLRDLRLLILVTLICYAIFGVFYGIVYKITSNSYYTIVSGAKNG